MFNIVNMYTFNFVTYFLMKVQTQEFLINLNFISKDYKVISGNNKIYDKFHSKFPLN